MHYYQEPTLIIKYLGGSKLFLGGISLYGTNSLQTIKSLEITHILNVAAEIKWDENILNKENIKVKHIPAFDIESYNIGYHFEEAFNYIDNALKQNGKVYVHCAVGVSRSPTIVISYIMRRYSMSYEDTYNYVKRLRNIINPNMGFRKILQEYQNKLNFYLTNDKNKRNSDDTIMNILRSINTQSTSFNNNNNNKRYDLNNKQRFYSIDNSLSLDFNSNNKTTRERTYSRVFNSNNNSFDLGYNARSNRLQSPISNFT